MAEDVAFFIFGGTGDLARRKLYPVLERLILKGKLKNLRALYSLGRERKKIEDWERRFRENLRVPFKFLEFDVSRRESYLKLSEEIRNLGGSELILYLALPPQLFETTVLHLGPLLRNFTNPRKIVVEKPFGFDLISAKRLNFELSRYFTEREIFRIDHFLGKLQVQNILFVRFSNYLFEGVWNKNFIDSIQVSALEKVGLEGRTAYYDRIGALRDMVQNHLLQILSFLTMEPPALMEAEKIRDEKVKVLHSIRRVEVSEVDRFAVRGQYRGYTQELGRDSTTETYVALKLYIDNFRWEGVPFYLRTGKRLKEKKTEAVVVFKRVPANFGRLLGCVPQQDKLAFEIAPRNRLILRFQVMHPEGLSTCSVESSMESEVIEDAPKAYETLLEDILSGDQSLFIREDESELAWEIVQPLMERWKEGRPYLYDPGSWGPKEAEELIERDGRRWILV